MTLRIITLYKCQPLMKIIEKITLLDDVKKGPGQYAKRVRMCAIA